MAEEKQQKSAVQTAQTAAGKAKDAAKLAKDVGRIAAGDMSAIKDVLMNKLVWEIILIFLVTISLVGMVIGAALTGVLEFISQSWNRNWEENWEYQGKISEGDLTYLQTSGWLLTVGNTFVDVGSDIVNAVSNLFSMNANANITDDSANNGHDANLNDDELLDAGYTPSEDSYKNTIEAIYTNEDGQLDSAITERLDMIKGRVRQRGLQLKKAVEQQYLKNASIFGKDSAYTKIAEVLNDKMESQYVDDDGNYVLYAGFNKDLSVINFDTSAFELTDLQALKILAIFSIQYDCQLTEIDMWSLMNYCGWYTGNKTGNLDDEADSIYNLSQSQTYGNNIGNVTFNGMPILSYELPTLQVPIWAGSCAPQWYYEELSAIREHNKYAETQWGLDVNTKLAAYTYTGAIEPTTVLTSNNVTYECTYDYLLYEDSGGYFAGSNYVGGTTYFPKCDKYVSGYFSPATNQKLTFDGLTAQKYYELKKVSYAQEINADGTKGQKIQIGVETIVTFQATVMGEWTDSEFYNFSNISSVQTFGIIDRLFYAGENNIVVKRSDYSSYKDWTKYEIRKLGTEIYNAWESYVWDASEGYRYGTVHRDTYGDHSFTYSKTISAPKSDSTTNIFTGNVTVKDYSYGIGLFKSSNKNKCIDYIGYSDATRTFYNLDGDTQYVIFDLVTTVTKVYDESGNLISEEEETKKDSMWGCFFTTLPDVRNLNAYEMYIEINLSFKARSVDEIAFDILGIWPESLFNYDKVVRETANGNLIGQNSADDDKYSYCLINGYYEISESGLTFGVYKPLLRSYSETNDTMPYVVTKTIFEYGIHNSSLSNVNSTPMSGWHQIAENGDHLIFEIDGTKHYFTYCRITTITTTLYEDGHTSEDLNRSLMLIDEICPGESSGSYIADTVVEDGKEYAAGHLGNELLLRNWTDIYYGTDEDGKLEKIEIAFERESGYQYESYVDMVMALAKLLDIDYSDWDEAMKRADELNLPKNSG